jgi:hypothetical protein
VNSKIESAFMDEMKKIGVGFSERPTQIIKKHPEGEVRRTMAKVRARGKDTSGRVKALLQQYHFSAPSSERALKGKV